MSARAETWIGLMSGTSVDAIDAVALSGSADDFKLIQHASHPWPEALQAALQALPTRAAPSWREWLQYDVAVAEQHALAVRALRAALPPSTRIRGIGFHGQTIFHAPELGNSLQLGSAAHLAALTRCDVYADFRRADMAVGGQGAPLAPALHARLWGAPTTSLAVINLGGIANISLVQHGEVVAGFDTGPANALLDAWCQTHFACAFDADGRIAASGTLDEALLGRLLSEPYFQRPAPKSTGRETFHLAWLEQHLGGQETPVDVLRTLVELSARTVATALHSHTLDGIILVGGGANNRLLRARLQALCPAVPLSSSQDHGWPESAIEAALFGWLAMQQAGGRTTSLRRATGARQDVILGAFYPAPPDPESASDGEG